MLFLIVCVCVMSPVVLSGRLQPNEDGNPNKADLLTSSCMEKADLLSFPVN